MISKAISFLTDYLNAATQLSESAGEDLVVASTLSNPDGSSPANLENKIVISVINLEQETLMQSLPGQKIKKARGDGFSAPPLNLNIYLMVAANFNSKNYLEGLKRLSSVLTAFQQNPYFTSQEFPELQAPISKISLELCNFPLAEISQIWNGLGSKYTPSIIYKLRMIIIQEELIRQEIPAISQVGKNPKGK